MKPILLFAMVQFLITCAFSQVGSVNFDFNPQQEQIISFNKIVREEVYSYTLEGNTVKDSALTTTYYYDAAGYFLKESSAKRNNSDASLTTYTNTYTATGKLRKQISDKQIADKQQLKIVSIYEFDYDSIGNEVTKYMYNKDTSRLTIEEKSYNDQHQVVQLRTKINNNNFYISRRYYYDQDNNLSKITALDTKGKVIYSYSYEYKKYPAKKTIYLENESGKNKTGEYFYNNNNQCIKVNSTVKNAAFIGKDGKESMEYGNFSEVTNYTYNKDKTLYESTVFLDGKKAQIKRHFYFQ